MRIIESLILLSLLSLPPAVFSQITDKIYTDYPKLRESILDTAILLDDRQRTISLNNYKNKLVILFFFTSRCEKCWEQAADLRKFYLEVNSNKFEILGIEADYSSKEKARLNILAARRKFHYDLGFANDAFFTYFKEISRFDRIPQAFLIYDGRLRGVFIGNSQIVAHRLKEITLKTLEETK